MFHLPENVAYHITYTMMGDKRDTRTWTPHDANSSMLLRSGRRGRMGPGVCTYNVMTCVWNRSVCTVCYVLESQQREGEEQHSSRGGKKLAALQ